MTCREFAKKHNIEIVGKLKRVPVVLSSFYGCIIYEDNDGNDFCIDEKEKEIIWVSKDGAVC